MTGAGGFIASWLVKLLLSKGYMVHGTVRDPSDGQNAHLIKLDNSKILHLFKANLLDYNSLASAIAGSGGVFHVASPVPSTKVTNPEVELIGPAVSGTLNVLKACSDAKVKRVLLVSSVAAVTLNPNWPRDKIMDESSWSDKEYCRKREVDVVNPAVSGTLNVLKACSKTEVKRAVVVSPASAVTRNPNWPKGKISDEECWSDKEYCGTTENWYCLSKTLAESEALEYEAKNGLDVVTVLPRMAIGPMLQSTINASSLIIINVLKGAMESIENNIQNIVDVRDVTDALLLVYEKPEASGLSHLRSSFSKNTRHGRHAQEFVSQLQIPENFY